MPKRPKPPNAAGMAQHLRDQYGERALEYAQGYAAGFYFEKEPKGRGFWQAVVHEQKEWERKRAKK